MTAVRALIFDLDGTLLDSVGDIGGAMNEALSARGWPTHAVPEYLKMVGEGIEVLARKAAPPGTPEPTVMALAQEYRARYALRMEQQTRPYDGITAMLDALAQRKLPMAILSNKKHEFTVELVKRQLGKWPFVKVAGERQGVPRKPDPTAALELAQALGFAPAEIAFVGDTPIDMKTANAAGMLPVAVLWGFRGRDELVGAGARHLLSHPRELLPLL